VLWMSLLMCHVLLIRCLPRPIRLVTFVLALAHHLTAILPLAMVFPLSLNQLLIEMLFVRNGSCASAHWHMGSSSSSSSCLSLVSRSIRLRLARIVLLSVTKLVVWLVVFNRSMVITTMKLLLLCLCLI
jgi:hypothetical protein